MVPPAFAAEVPVRFVRDGVALRPLLSLLAFSCALLGGGSGWAGSSEQLWVVQDRNWRPQPPGEVQSSGGALQGNASSRALAEASHLKLRVRRSIPSLGAVAVTVEPSDKSWKENLRRLADREFRVFPVTPVESTEVFPADPFWSQQWHLQNFGQAGGMPTFDLGASGGWTLETGSSQTVIAITDSGVQSDHIDLVGRMWTNPGEIPNNGLDDEGNGYVDDVFGWNTALNAPGPLNDPALAGHGTAVAGTAGATTSNGIGVAGVHWQARLMPVVIFDPFYVGTDLTASEGIVYAVRAGAHIVNASWGSREASPLFDSAVEFAAAHGVPVVAAAGNDGVSSDLHPFYPAAIRHDYLVSVGGANRFGGWSHNFGRHRVSCTAPSVDIYQPRLGNAFGFGSGTSYASPQVAGMLGLMRDRGGLGDAVAHHLRLQGTARAFPGLSERSASSGLVRLDDVLSTNTDVVSPAAVADLQVERVGFNGMVLTWTAVGDDGWIGTAAGYSLRVSDRSLTDVEFSIRPAVPITIGPAPSGQRMSAVVSGLDAGTTYIVQIRAHDEAGNRSAVSAGVPVLTGAFPNQLRFDPCDVEGTHWTPAGGMALAPGQGKTGAFTWQDSPSGLYSPGSTATLSLSSPMDLSGVPAPGITFYHRRQFPNSDRGDALRLEIQRPSESTVTLLWELGGSWSPTDLVVVPIPRNLVVDGPVVVRFRLQSDAGSGVSDGVHLDDISIVDLTGSTWLPHQGEIVLDPRSWTGNPSPISQRVGAWTTSTLTNLAPGSESLGTWEVLSSSSPSPQLEWLVPLCLPGQYALDVAWPEGAEANPVALDVETGGDLRTFLYHQQSSESSRWRNLGIVSLLAGNWTSLDQVRVRADLSATSGTILAPSVRLRWIYPLQSGAAADPVWSSLESFVPKEPVE